MGTTTSEAGTTGKTLADLRGVGRKVAKDAGGSTVAAFFETNKSAIAAVLPQHMTADRMLKIALRCLRTTPKLMGCTVDSLFASVVTCAQMGLEPNTPQGHIYLIPFENKRKGVVEVQVIIGYKGLIELARRSGEIESISARVVYERDTFEVNFGTEDNIIHRPYLDGDAGATRGFYAVAKLKGGGTQFEFMSVPGVDRIRDGSQGFISAKRFPKNGQVLHPWVQHYEEMGRKTLIRRLSKYLPMSIELAGAVAIDEHADRGIQDLSKVLDGVDYTIVSEEEEEEQETSETNAGTATSESKPAADQKTETTARRSQSKSAPEAPRQAAVEHEQKVQVDLGLQTAKAEEVKIEVNTDGFGLAE